MTTTETDSDQGRDDSPPEIEDQDLDLVDDALEDEGKDDAEIWDELDQEEGGASAGDAPDDTSGADADDAPPIAASSDVDDDAASTDEQLSDEPDGDEPSGEEPATGEEDLWTGASDEQRAAFDAAQAQIKKLEQSDRSQRGRLSAMQHQLNELTAKPPATDKGAGEGGDGEGDEDVFTSDDFKSFESEYPEVAAPIKKLVSGLQSQVTDQRKLIDAIGTDRRDDAINEQTDLLEEDHPDWEDVTAAEEFMPWLDDQPRHIQEAALRNAEEIVDAAEAADVVGRFKAFRSAQEDTGAETPGAETPEAGNGQGDGTARLTGKRQRQLESASGTRRGGPGVAHGIPEDGDPEKIWKDFDRLEQRQAQRA